MFHYILLFYMNFMEKTTSCLLRGDSPVNHWHVHCFTGGAIKTNRGKAVNRLLLVAALATTTALAAPAHAVDTSSALSTWQGAVSSYARDTRSEGRRGGKECVRTGRTRRSPYHKKKKTTKTSNND